MNQILNTGIIPDKFKIAKVIPIYKKDDPSLFTNYRPISLLPGISKIIEKIVFNQLSVYFKDSKLFTEHQYGFRKEHSTEHAVLELIDRITKTMDNDEIPINIYLDLSKAFDTLEHNIIIGKLRHYGVEGVSLSLFQNYLTNRKQYVEYNNAKSDTLNINTGVPQGSILGPLLFIIYINDFSQASKLFNFIAYADDTTLTSTLSCFGHNATVGDRERKINAELGKIDEWLKINKLSLNIKKTKFMIFAMPTKKYQVPLIQLNDVVIERVSNFNFLGVTLDEQLNWKKHIDKMSIKCSKTVGILNKLKLILPINIKILLYNTLLIPHINYCLMAWGFNCNRLYTLQKKAIRIISQSKYNAHTSPLFKKLKLLKLQDLLKLQQLKFYYKYTHKRLPTYLQKLPLYPRTDTHHHYTRNCSQIATFSTRHTFATKCISYNIPRTINNTPGAILQKIHTHSIHGFSTYTQLVYINAYSDTCTTVDCYICAQ